MLVSAVYIAHMRTKNTVLLLETVAFMCIFSALKRCAIIGDMLLLETFAYIRENTVLNIGDSG